MLESYKHTMAGVYSLFELIAECSYGGYSLKVPHVTVDLPCSLHKHREAETTHKSLERGSMAEVIVARMKAGLERGAFEPTFVGEPNPRSLCVFYCRTLDLQMNKGGNKVKEALPGPGHVKANTMAHANAHTRTGALPRW